MIRRYISALLLILCWYAPCAAFAQNHNLKLWYDKPAEKWTDALPIGNGRLGAMLTVSIYNSTNKHYGLGGLGNLSVKKRQDTFL